MKRLGEKLLGRFRRPVTVAFRPDPKWLIFDFDGTLADSIEIGFEVYNSLADQLGFRRMNCEEFRAVREVGTLQALKLMGIPLRRVSAMVRLGREGLAARMDEIRPFHGIPEMLRELHARGFRLGILTSNAPANVQCFLKAHDLELFEWVRSSSRLLGKAHEFRAILKEHQLAPDGVLTIGDELRDVEAAQTARVPVAAVCWGYASRAALKGSHPSLILEKPRDLLSALRR